VDVAGVFTATVSLVAGPGALLVEPAAPEFIDGQRRRFVKRAGGDFNAVPDVLAVGEGNDASAGGGHRGYCSSLGEERANPSPRR